jgi:hypothetical protein
LFDKHQDVKYSRADGPVKCRHPQDMGLALDRWGVWRTPEAVLGVEKRVATMRAALKFNSGKR